VKSFQAYPSNDTNDSLEFLQKPSINGKVNVKFLTDYPVFLKPQKQGQGRT
jgi:hypothetical protein